MRADLLAARKLIAAVLGQLAVATITSRVTKRQVLEWIAKLEDGLQRLRAVV